MIVVVTIAHRKIINCWFKLRKDKIIESVNN